MIGRLAKARTANSKQNRSLSPFFKITLHREPSTLSFITDLTVSSAFYHMVSASSLKRNPLLSTGNEHVFKSQDGF